MNPNMPPESVRAYLNEHATPKHKRVAKEMMDLLTDPIAAAVAAHKAALEAREAMDAAAKERGEAIRAAFVAGYTAPQLAEALGVRHAQRIYAMSKQ